MAMSDKELIRSLQRLAVVEDPAYRCIGCGHEHNCSIHGCKILKEAAERIGELCPIRTPEVERTADEMFADIGYKQRPVPECVERWTARIYENKSGTMSIEIQYSGFVTARENNQICDMTGKEILASAQAVKEVCPNRTPEDKQ